MYCFLNLDRESFSFGFPFHFPFPGITVCLVFIFVLILNTNTMKIKVENSIITNQKRFFIFFSTMESVSFIQKLCSCFKPDLNLKCILNLDQIFNSNREIVYNKTKELNMDKAWCCFYVG